MNAFRHRDLFDFVGRQFLTLFTMLLSVGSKERAEAGRERYSSGAELVGVAWRGGGCGERAGQADLGGRWRDEVIAAASCGRAVLPPSLPKKTHLPTSWADVPDRPEAKRDGRTDARQRA